jgi:DNA invertase Pin-like site-specific DNA recombinase
MQKSRKNPPKSKFDPTAEPYLIGYARVSMADQSPDLQIDALVAAGVPRERIYYDQASGSGVKRPQLDLMLQDARVNDIIVIWKLDRLGRSTRQVLNTFFELDNKGAKVRVLTQPLLDTTTPMGQFFVAVMAAFAELEKDIIRERTKAGLAAAKARGRVGGRQSLCTDEEILATKRMRPTEAQKRLGFRNLASYIRRLAVAEANKAKADSAAPPAPEDGKESP